MVEKMQRREGGREGEREGRSSAYLEEGLGDQGRRAVSSQALVRVVNPMDGCQNIEVSCSAFGLSSLPFLPPSLPPLPHLTSFPTASSV